MLNTAQEIYTQVVSALPLNERLRLATLILNDLVQNNVTIIDRNDTWAEQDKLDLMTFSVQHSAMLFPEDEGDGLVTFNPGDVVTVDFPDVTGVKRRPALVLSSTIYHATRRDLIVGLITTQTTGLGITDYTLQDWSEAGLRVASVFRSFIVTLPSSANLIYIGQLSERDWKGVCAYLKVAIAGFDQLNND